MRVLHLLKTAVGASWALRQTTELVKLGVEVHLALPDGPMVLKYQQAGVKVHLFDPSLSIKYPWENISKIRVLRALVAEIQPDIIHSHFVITTLLMRLGLKKSYIPRIFHVPGPLHLEHSLFRNIEIGLANNRDYWLASCLWTKTRYECSGIAKDRIGLAYYGVNEDDFFFKSAPEFNLKSELNLSKDSFIVGMVAYFYAPKKYLGQSRGLKGHEDLIDAIAIVKQSHPQVRCVFVGGSWGNTQNYFEQVKAYAKQQCDEDCIFLGLRNDVPQLYPQFDLAVHPSHSENVGGAVESMYAQVATLTTNVGGFPDLVVEGETGYMVEAKSPKQLANKIIQAIEHPLEKQRQIENALVKVTQVMNVQQNAKQVYNFYHQVLQLEGQKNA